MATTTPAQSQSYDSVSLGAERNDWRTTLSNALIITRREVRDSFRDWRIVVPIFVLTFLFPFLAQFVAGEFSEFLSGYGAELIGERTIPFLLMIVGFFPISISLVIALETFVGEKERKSLEPLLSTPLTNTELYVGKTLAAMIPPLTSSFGGMAVYLATLVFSDLAWRPQLMLIVQIVLLTTVQALVMVTGAVVVSSQTTSTRAANLLASFIIIPMALLIQGESVIMFLAPDADSPGGIAALWAIIVGMAVAVVLLLRVGNSIFNREELLGRSIDSLNLRRTFRNLWMWIRAVDRDGTPARNLLDWYRRAIPYSLGKLRRSAWVTIGVFVFVFIAGVLIGLQPQWQLPLEDSTTVVGSETIQQITPLGGSSNLGGVMFYVRQNAGILLAALILAMFSFGVAALVMTPAVYAVLGYSLVQIVISGNSILLVLAAVVPHGIVEIPVIVVAVAASLQLGAVITKPPEGETVGRAFIAALGDAIKIFAGIVLPGLFIAGFIEAFITPQLVLAVLGG